MKVIEPHSDREAEVYLHVIGKLNSVDEYDQYIDSETKAICCYVPLSLGDKLEIGGTFSGTVRVIVIYPQ